MKKQDIGLCSWSLENDLDRISATMQESELTRLHLEISAIEHFGSAIKQNGWEVSCTMIGFPQEDYTTLESIRLTGGIIPDSSWEQNRVLMLDAIQKTAAINVPFLTTHVGFIDHNDTKGYTSFCKKIIELSDAAAAAGIMILMETGQETAEDLRYCLEDLHHPALGVNFDPANMIMYDKGNPIDAVRILAPWIKHVHIKDATASNTPGEWGAEVPWGEGEVPHQEFLNTLKDIGYQGHFAIEREAGDTRQADICLAAQRLN